MEVHEGGCLCGEIRFRVTGRPLRAFACHCRFCQRRTGSVLGVVGIFPQRDIEFSGTAPGTYTHISDESGRWLRLDFCRRCATSIRFALEHRPDDYLLAGGTFDEPNWFEPTHIWTRSKADWMALPEGCEWYETTPAAGPRTPIATGSRS